jgi:citrate lyase subunit beta / citryl-CoA lyase
MSDPAKHRSFLFVPGDRPERFAKALAGGADAVIIDLEDAVAPDHKHEARETLVSWLARERPVMIRVNARDSPWFEQDAELCKLPGVAGIVLPKAERAADIIDLVSHTKNRLPIFPLIESAKGMMNALEIAKAPFVHQLMFGTLDFCADMHMASDGDELNSFRAGLVMVSRVVGLRAPIDGVTPAIDDQDALNADTVNAKRHGFAGKLCIHPKQVPMVNQCFAPSASEVAWARSVLDAFKTAKGAAVAIDGKMIDRPVVIRAQNILNDVRFL